MPNENSLYGDLKAAQAPIHVACGCTLIQGAYRRSAWFALRGLSCEAIEISGPPHIRDLPLDSDDHAALIPFIPVRPVRRDASWASGDSRLWF
jgi:hypothetical protein